MGGYYFRKSKTKVKPAWEKYFRAAYELGNGMISVHLVLPAPNVINLRAIDRIMRGAPARPPQPAKKIRIRCP